MSKNLSEALYLGTAILLLALAITFFFSCYNTFEDYMLQGNDKVEEDGHIKISMDYGETKVTGEQVLFQILEFKRQKELSELKSMYENCQSDVPDLWVNGQRADTIETSAFDTSRLYKIQYDTDPSGRIIAVRYTGS